jgi:hypothetical protein
MLTRSEATPSAKSVSGSHCDWNATLCHYRDAATRVIDEHLRTHRWCLMCGTVWPCAPVLAAEFVLEL